MKKMKQLLAVVLALALMAGLAGLRREPGPHPRPRRRRGGPCREHGPR